MPVLALGLSSELSQRQGAGRYAHAIAYSVCSLLPLPKLAEWAQLLARELEAVSTPLSLLLLSDSPPYFSFLKVVVEAQHSAEESCTGLGLGKGGDTREKWQQCRSSFQFSSPSTALLCLKLASSLPLGNRVLGKAM